jgi:uncharacterized protein
VNFAWADFLGALAFFLVLEGLLPFFNPGGARRLFAHLSGIAERELRIAGLISMLVGLTFLFFIRS